MLKLLRNTLGECSLILDGNGGTVDWKYLTLLQELQENEGLHLGNKIRKAHVYFGKQKMKVKLAVQILSKSVADALNFCREELDLPAFRNSKPTAGFLIMLNNTFDILNSHNLSDFGLKRALCESNWNLIQETVSSSISYIISLKLPSGELLVEHRRKTGFVGLIVCLKNLNFIYTHFIETNKLHYVSIYKLNQDHLELYF